MRPGWHLTAIYIFLVITLPSFSQGSSYCKNIGFEMGNFTNWTGYTWRYRTDNSPGSPAVNTPHIPGIVYRRQTIMSDTSEYDKNTGYALRKVPKGSLFSARIGDEITNNDLSSVRNWNQSLQYTMTIDSNNAFLVLKFALVLQYADDHVEINEPRFKMTLFDKDGNELPDCSNYDVYSSNKNIKGFKTFVPTVPQGGRIIPVMWRDWSSVGANLSGYIGQTITIEFMTSDCTKGFHYGYAYFVAECHPLFITTKYCAADTAAILAAPTGFESYLWKDEGGNLLDTVQNLAVMVPKERVHYSCTMTSATGCVITLNTSILKYVPEAEFKSFMLDCFSNTVQFSNLSTTNHGSLLYTWLFEEGESSDVKDPPHTFSTSGLHKVSLIIRNQPSSCTDTITKIVESFSPPLVGISGDTTYCPGLSTWMKAYGAASYDWSTGSKADSLEVASPGGKFWMVGHSTTGCRSDTLRRQITEEPDWDFIPGGDTIICGSSSVVLKASGAAGYKWSNGSENDSITVASGGVYAVLGNNKRGCKKSLSFNVTEHPVPDPAFTFSPATLDSRRNTLQFSSIAEPGVTYFWDPGDNSTETGSSSSHTYNISNSILEYRIKLKAVTEFNCIDTLSKYVDVVPFVPNVFSPNDDGINDRFMQGFDLQIADRNGMILYKGSDGWDGRYNGKLADPDNYFYILYYTDSREKIHSRKGYLLLVR